MKKVWLALSIAFVAFVSCSEDIDLTANYKDIPVIYAALNYNEDTNWVRIEKAFLGDGDALVYAAIADSIFYGTNMKAYLVEFNSSGNKVDSVELVRVVDPFQKDSGIFAYNTNVLYRTTKTLNKDNSYKIVIAKPDGTFATSTTPMSNRVTMVNPATPSSIVIFENPVSTVTNVKYTLRWLNGKNNVAFQLKMGFEYDEWEVGTPLVVTRKKFYYTFPMIASQNYLQNGTITTSEEITFDITKERFYGIITQNVPEDDASTPPLEIRQRRFISLEFIVSSAAEELYKFIDLNGPSLSYVQKVSAYTNVTNGLGVWSSRYTAGGISSLNINTQTRDSLIGGQYTNQLNFVP